MTDQALADRVVALGVGELKREMAGEPVYVLSDASGYFPFLAENFIRDPRVAMALMERLTGAKLMEAMYRAVYYIFDGAEGDNPLPRAIIAACVEALEEKNA